MHKQQYAYQLTYNMTEDTTVKLINSKIRHMTSFQNIYTHT